LKFVVAENENIYTIIAGGKRKGRFQRKSESPDEKVENEVVYWGNERTENITENDQGKEERNDEYDGKAGRGRPRTMFLKRIVEDTGRTTCKELKAAGDG